MQGTVNKQQQRNQDYIFSFLKQTRPAYILSASMSSLEINPNTCRGVYTHVKSTTQDTGLFIRTTNIGYKFV